jgi:GntR family transcriptional regulator / MocR family aminotransferase
MLFLNIEKGKGHTLIKQIYEQLRNKILNGEFKAGEKLVSTRKMAQLLNVSRNTIMTAYDMLISEGYVTSVPGSGMFIAQGIEFIRSPEKLIDYSVTAFSSQKLAGDSINCHSGTPALDLFPRHKWNKIASQVFKEAPISAFGYDFPQGRPELRNVLSAYLKKSRGINCHPDQIMITTGAKQGLTLIAKCLLQQESEAWIEDPTNANVRKIFSYHTNHITPIPVDQEGIRPELFPQDRCPALIFVTPSHQFPMGGILSIQRRLELVRYARKTGCYIIEDDYDSEFRYKGLPTNSLQELDNERVIYIGTFSKILFPSLRLGYIVLPYALIERCKEWKRLGDHHTNSLNQLTLMRFIKDGELERHISRMKRIYGQRRNNLIALIDIYFPGKVRIIGEMAGMHVVAEFSGVIFTNELMQKIRDAGVNIIGVEEHALAKGYHTSQVILGYAHLSLAEIEEGLSRLKEALAPVMVTHENSMAQRQSTQIEMSV